MPFKSLHFSADGTKLLTPLKIIYTYMIYHQCENSNYARWTKNKIINGITDWVYEEEFAFVKAYDWNVTGTKSLISSLMKRKFQNFQWICTTKVYIQRKRFKYPKAGEKTQLFRYIFSI